MAASVFHHEVVQRVRRRRAVWVALVLAQVMAASWKSSTRRAPATGTGVADPLLLGLPARGSRLINRASFSVAVEFRDWAAGPARCRAEYCCQA